MGYTNVKVFAAGYPAWVKYIKGTAPHPVKTQLKAGKDEGSLDTAVFEKILKNNPQSILLVDVRDPDEYKAGSFKTAVNIPVDELEKKLKNWKVDKPVVFFCSTGARSGEAYYMVLDMRPDLKDKVYFVAAEISFDGKGGYKLTPSK